MFIQKDRDAINLLFKLRSCFPALDQCDNSIDCQVDSLRIGCVLDATGMLIKKHMQQNTFTAGHNAFSARINRKGR